VLLGTVAYMSPEQVRGEVLDHRSDIFSFGSVLYELLMGRKAFERGSAAETMAAILKEEPELRGTSIPPALGNAVGHCLEKNPERRFHSMHDVAFVLREAGAQPAGSSPQLLAEKPRVSGLAGGMARRIGLSAAAVAVVAILAVWFVRQMRPGPPAPPGSSPGQPARIVVLPFENLGSAEDGYFAAGITEEITSRLANVRKLGVISRTTATEYPRKGKTVKQVGADLGVDWVLEGTIRCDRSGGGPGRVRITPQLIRVSDDTHVWSERYDRTLTDIFSLQSEVATKTVEAIGIGVVPVEKANLGTIPTKDLIAYDHYLKGLAAAGHSLERSDIEEALGHFQEAVNRDPSFVPALTQLSYCHLLIYWLSYDRSKERLEKGRAAAEAAARLGPDLPETHVALGFLYYWGSRDYARATEEFEAARRIRPNDDQATAGLAYIFKRLGRWRESAAMLEQVAKRDPRNAEVLINLALSLASSRRYAEADGAWATAASLSPHSGTVWANRVWSPVLWRGDIGRAKALLAEAERVPALRDDRGSLARTAYLVSLMERDFAGALRRLDADSGRAYSHQSYFLPIDLLRSEIHYLVGRVSDSRRTAEKARILLEEARGKEPDDARLESALGIALALLGRNDEALRAARRGVELMPTSKDAAAGLPRIEDLAFVYAMLGRQDEAIEQLGALLSASGWMTPYVLRLDPRWDALRKNPKFEALLVKYGVRS
jgi:TolB-like protein/Flp pilus assembly protein TadD